MRHLIILIVIFFFSFGAMAQDVEVEENLPNILKLNPISLAFGNFNLSYQRALSNSSAIQIGANYWYRILGTEVKGYGVRGIYQFFLTNRVKAAPEGFYVGPQVSFNSLTEKDTDKKVTTTGIGVVLGYQWVWTSGIALDLGAGPMYQFADESDSDNSYEGFLPNIVIAIGFNF